MAVVILASTSDVYGQATPPFAEDDPIVVVRGDDPRGLARDGLVGLGYSATEADQLLEDAPDGTPEVLIAHALKVARR